MSEAAFVQAIGLIVSMGLIVVLGTVGGFLLSYFENRMAPGREH